MHLKYFIAKILGKILRKNFVNIYLRRAGVNIEGRIYCYSDIVTMEAYLITIKNGTTISNDVQFVTHDNSVEKLHIGFSDLFGEIIIGEHCFIGARSIILPGVILGDHCIVGSGSVVTKSFPAGSVVGGNPAKLITTTDKLAEKVRGIGFSIEGLTIQQKRELILENRNSLKRR